MGCLIFRSIPILRSSNDRSLMLLTYEHTMFADTGTIHEKAWKNKTRVSLLNPRKSFVYRAMKKNTDGDEPDIVHTTPSNIGNTHFLVVPGQHLERESPRSLLFGGSCHWRNDDAWARATFPLWSEPHAKGYYGQKTLSCVASGGLKARGLMTDVLQ